MCQATAAVKLKTESGVSWGARYTEYGVEWSEEARKQTDLQKYSLSFDVEGFCAHLGEMRPWPSRPRAPRFFSVWLKKDLMYQQKMQNMRCVDILQYGCCSPCKGQS